MRNVTSTDGFVNMQGLSPVPPRGTQRGITLFVVVIFVLLSMLLVLWASRTALFNEMVVGNDVDYQRAFEAAQALIQDAELDIRGQRADGTACVGAGNVCRTATAEKIPLGKEWDQLLADLELKDPTQCANALCVRRPDGQDFWSDDAVLSQMKAVGARYGTYTGATTGAGGQTANPILAAAGANQGGWYWIEILPYVGGEGYAGGEGADGTVIVGGANMLSLDLGEPYVVYRITALAYGRKPNTMVVLQETYARPVRKD